MPRLADCGRESSAYQWGGEGFGVQSADLHSVWGAYKKRNKFRRLGALKVCGEEGRWIVALMRFPDNVLMATNTQPDEY